MREWPLYFLCDWNAWKRLPHQKPPREKLIVGEIWLILVSSLKKNETNIWSAS